MRIPVEIPTAILAESEPSIVSETEKS